MGTSIVKRPEGQPWLLVISADGERSHLVQSGGGLDLPPRALVADIWAPDLTSAERCATEIITRTRARIAAEAARYREEGRRRS